MSRNPERSRWQSEAELGIQKEVGGARAYSAPERDSTVMNMGVGRWVELYTSVDLGMNGWGPFGLS